MPGGAKSADCSQVLVVLGAVTLQVCSIKDVRQICSEVGFSPGLPESPGKVLLART